MDTDAVEPFAHGLQKRLHDRVVIDSEVLVRTVSIGVAVGVPGRDSTSDLLRRADQAAVAAKRAGRSRIAVLTQDMSPKPPSRNDIALHLEEVLDDTDGAVVLHYLHEVDLRTGRFSALRRWLAGNTQREDHSYRTRSSA
jgi:predicted signal transduction protein with EAL and GGDEF domain